MHFAFCITRGRQLLWNPMFRKELCVTLRLRAIRVFRVKNAPAKNLLMLFNNRANHSSAR